MALTVVGLQSKLFRRAFIRGGRLALAVTVDVRGNIGEVTSRTNVADPEVLRRVEQVVAGQILQQMNATVSRLKELNVDAAGFGEVVHRQMPAVWRQTAGTWDTSGFRQLEVVPEVSVRLEKIGTSRSPIAPVAPKRR